MKFRLVDKIFSWTPYQCISGIKTVSFEEYCLKEAFGDEARLPECLLLESFLQLGNWLILLSTDFTQMGVVSLMRRITFHDYLRPGQQVRMQVTFTRQRPDGYELTGEGVVNGRSVISGIGCLASTVATADYVNPDDLRVLFSEIYQPGSHE